MSIMSHSLVLVLLMLLQDSFAADLVLQRVPLGEGRLPCVPASSILEVLHPYSLSCPTTQTRPFRPDELLPRLDNINLPNILECLALYPALHCSISDPDAGGSVVHMNFYQVDPNPCSVVVQRVFRPATRPGFVSKEFIPKGGGSGGGSHKGAAYSNLIFPQPIFGSRLFLGGWAKRPPPSY